MITLAIDPDLLVALRRERAVRDRAENLAAALERLRDTATLLPKLLDLLFAEIPAKQGGVLIADEGGRELERSFFRGNPFAINKDVAEWAFRKRTAVLQPDSAAVLCAPACLRRSTVGAIYLESGRLGAFTEDHL